MENNQYEILRGIKTANAQTPYFIKSILISNKIDDSNVLICCLKLELSIDLSNSLESVCAEFYNVTINSRLNFTMSQLSGIAIEDIRERQMENCNYHVFDYEGDDYDFYCERINITNKYY